MVQMLVLVQVNIFGDYLSAICVDSCQNLGWPPSVSSSMSGPMKRKESMVQLCWRLQEQQWWLLWLVESLRVRLHELASC